jgi:hypothetical protein
VQEFHELDEERPLVAHRFTARGKTSSLGVERGGSAGANLFYIRNEVTRLVAYMSRGQAFTDLALLD